MNSCEMRELLVRIGVDASDREFIVRANEVMGEEIAAVSAEFCDFEALKAKTGLYTMTRKFIDRVDLMVKDGYHKYTAELLFWIHTIPIMKEEYARRGIPEDLLYESMTDISYKIRECREVYGVTGVFCDWFFLFTAIRLFRFGRLEFEVAEFLPEYYSRAGVELKKGDTVYSCHIPSSGRMTREACIESYQRAYDFFKDELSGAIIPIVCHSYLFWPPYLGRVFEQGSNTADFIRSYDIVETFERGNFADFWRIFNRYCDGSTENLPRDTSVRRNFIRYIEEGGKYGNGYGVLLFDGEKGEIL